MFLRNVVYVLINLAIILPLPLGLATHWKIGVVAWLGIQGLVMAIIAVATIIEAVQRRRSRW